MSENVFLELGESPSSRAFFLSRPFPVPQEFIPQLFPTWRSAYPIPPFPSKKEPIPRSLRGGVRAPGSLLNWQLPTNTRTPKRTQHSMQQQSRMALCQWHFANGALPMALSQWRFANGALPMALCHHTHMSKTTHRQCV